MAGKLFCYVYFVRNFASKRFLRLSCISIDCNYALVLNSKMVVSF